MMCSICCSVALSDMFTIMAMTFLFAAKKRKPRFLIAASAESLSCLYFSADWLRFCTAADANE